MRVFKYRGGSKEILERDIRTLENDQIFSAPIVSLNDPFEARVKIHEETFRIGKIFSLLTTFKYTDQIKEAGKQFLKSLNAFLESSKKWGIYSLSKSYKDELLWAYYADSHRGFCIEYNLEELVKYKIGQEIIIDVEYKSDIPIITINDLINISNIDKTLSQKIIGTKSTRWAHESEIRILTGRTGLYDFDYRAVKSFYFGHRSNEDFQRRLMEVLKGRGIKYYLVAPVDDTYKLEKTEIADLYGNAEKYRARIAPIEEGVPYLDKTISPYSELISKAIEIVRRDPYCEKVVDAYISGSKGTDEDPVFYITYERSDGIPQNFYLSKSEIEAAII